MHDQNESRKNELFPHGCKVHLMIPPINEECTLKVLSLQFY